MDFSFTEAQQDLAGLTRRIVTDHATPDRLREVESGPDRHDPALWAALARSEVLSAALPASVGGADFGLLEQCSVLIELGRAVAAVPYLSTVAVAGAALAEFGTQEQRSKWLTPALVGDVVLTAALGEPHAPAGAVASTRAERHGATWVLHGKKTGVLAGGVAGLFLVPARTSDGVAVFLVSPDDPGVQVDRQEVVDSDSEAWLGLDGVRLPEDRVLGDPARGSRITEWLNTRATIGVCAAQLGVLERGLELTAEYARERVQFDRPIGSFQAVSQRLADAYIDVEAVRLTLWQAAWLASEGHECAAEVATAKFWAGDAGHRVAHTVVHVHGGVGIDIDHVVHRYFVAAKRYEFALGNATQQALRLGSILA